jgi:peptide subunit release factor 1 (eRF1)
MFMITDLDIRQALEFECPDSPVLSIYLNVDPHRRSAEKYRLALRSLLDKANDAAPEDVRKIQNYVETGYNWHGRGLILFSCTAQDFWWAHSLPIPVEDQVFVSFRAYVRPLAAMLDAYERLGVIHVDQMGARLYLFHLGNLEAAEGHLGEEIHMHRAGGWAASRYQRHEAELARQNLGEAAELAEAFYRRANIRRLILAGTEKNVATFRSMLSNRLRSLVIGEIPAGAHATPTEIQELASDLAHEAAKEAGSDLADMILTTAHKGGNAVLGLADTLNAVQTGRAQRVVVLSGYSQPAFRYKDSKFVVLSEDEVNASGSEEAIEALPDAVDSVMRRSLLYGIPVTVLTEHEALEKAGKIGALTRY